MIFFSSSSSSATAFPFNNVENNGALQDSGTGSSSSNGSVPDTPEVVSGNRFPVETGLPETKKLKQKKLVTTPTTTVVNITRLPCLPERSTYPVELAESLPMSKYFYLFIYFLKKLSKFTRYFHSGH